MSRPAVIIASAGRPELLAQAVANVDRLVGEPQKLLSVPDASSLPEERLLDGWTVVTGRRGAAAQRNAAIDLTSEDATVFFFDDDSVVRSDYLQEAVKFFAAHPDVIGLTGRVLLDGGATSYEVSEDDAARAIEQSWQQPRTGAWRYGRELYGCNFAYRRGSAPHLRFDERLPLYSWLEDHDLARRLMRLGRLARVDDCVVVHRGAASGGRHAHVRLGYSQVMNPVYLCRAGSFPVWLALRESVPRVLKNALRSLRHEERVWRRQRLRGNTLAFLDLLRGRVSPERIVDL